MIAPQRHAVAVRPAPGAGRAADAGGRVGDPRRLPDSHTTPAPPQVAQVFRIGHPPRCAERDAGIGVARLPEPRRRFRAMRPGRRRTPPPSTPPRRAVAQLYGTNLTRWVKRIRARADRRRQRLLGAACGASPSPPCARSTAGRMCRRPGLESRHRREPAGRDHRARGPRAGSAPYRRHEPGRFLYVAGGPRRGVRPGGVAARVPHHPAGGRPPARRAEPRGGLAARPGRGRGDRRRHRAGAAPRSRADRSRRLRDRGRDRQPADLGPRLRALRPPEADGPGGRAGADLAERAARRELGIHHRRRGREERLLRLRAGRAGPGGWRRPGGAGIRAGVSGGHERLLRRGRPLGRRRHERDHQERHQRAVRFRRPLPAR